MPGRLDSALEIPATMSGEKLQLRSGGSHGGSRPAKNRRSRLVPQAPMREMIMSWRSWGLLGTRPPKHAWCERA